MMTNSDHTQTIKNALNKQLENTPDDVQSALRQARLNAINAPSGPNITRFKFASLALACSAIVSGVLYLNMPDSVTPIPEAVLYASAPAPNEEIEMLEDLEFMIWLSENEQLL